MKKILAALVLALVSFSASAEKVRSKINSLDIGIGGEPHLVKMETGRVAFLEYGEKTLLKQLEDAMNKGKWIEATIGKKSALESFKIIRPEAPEVPPTSMTPTEINDPYRPTVMTYAKAQNIFYKMRRDYKQSGQCFNRAHIWTYEEYTRAKTNLNKVFLFFTSRYIRNYNFGWWFHVTPMAYVGGTTSGYWRMLDRRYTSGPLTSKTWTDIFIRSKRTCKIVKKYSSYRDNQQSQDCYLIQASMYYLVPSDLAMLEEEGTERTAYEPVEIDYALWDAFRTE